MAPIWMTILPVTVELTNLKLIMLLLTAGAGGVVYAAGIIVSILEGFITANGVTQFG